MKNEQQLLITPRVLNKMRRYAYKLRCTVGDIYYHFWEAKQKYPNMPDDNCLVTAYKRALNECIERSCPVSGGTSTTYLKHGFRSVSIDDLNNF